MGDEYNVFPMNHQLIRYFADLCLELAKEHSVVTSKEHKFTKEHSLVTSEEHKFAEEHSLVTSLQRKGVLAALTFRLLNKSEVFASRSRQCVLAFSGILMRCIS